MGSTLLGVALGILIMVILVEVQDSGFRRRREKREILEATLTEFDGDTTDEIQSAEAGIKILGDRIVIELDKPLQNIYLSVEKAKILAHSLYRLSDELESEDEK